MFWELLDEILNAVLFVLIGMEVLLIAFTGRSCSPGWSRSRSLLFARWLTVGLPVIGSPASASGCRTDRPGADLGRAARRHLGGPGAVAAGRAPSRDTCWR